MNLHAIDTAKVNTQSLEPKKQAELRDAAKQFESVLLLQLTSALSGANNDDEDKLFGNDAGAGLAQKMFSEQMATTIADAGGIGLSEIIFNHLSGGAAATKPADGLNKNMKAALSAVRDIKSNGVVALTGEQIIFGESGAPAAIENKTSIENASLSGDDFAVVSASEMTDEAAASNAFLNENAKRLLKEAKIKIKPADANVDVSKMTRPRIVGETKGDIVKPKMSVEFQSPVEGRLSSRFGNRFHPIDHKVKFHQGIDIAAPRGTAIKAAAEGTVVFAGWSKGYGNTVVIEHADGRQTRYAHAQKLFVSKGDRIDAGEKIAAVGSTGKSTGPHLHFEIIENNRRINPLKILAQDFSHNRR